MDRGFFSLLSLWVKLVFRFCFLPLSLPVTVLLVPAPSWGEVSSLIVGGGVVVVVGGGGGGGGEEDVALIVLFLGLR